VAAETGRERGVMLDLTEAIAEMKVERLKLEQAIEALEKLRARKELSAGSRNVAHASNEAVVEPPTHREGS
jgi:hypothetical protein